ncbi:MAG: teicoplanin resistance protein VanZ [Calditrichaeota bacterium]|nr:teicoplanin resistance protein VanZ [Calditrichota bacterium]
MKLSILWAILYAMLIIGLSSIPGRSFPDIKYLSQDKLIHIGEYLIFGILVGQAIAFRVTARSRIFLFTLLLAGAFGALDEVYQTLIPGRDNSYADWIADLLGVIAGSSLFLMWRYYRDQAAAD